VTDDAYGDRYGVQYSIYGRDLQLDSLLASRRPSMGARVWRSGDERGPGRLAKTSGVSIQVVVCATPAEVVSAIEAFVTSEETFLRAAADHVTATTLSVLSCAMWVYAAVPSTVALPVQLMARLAELSIEWSVTGYPCADKTGP
jgi:hypothetical protein